MLSNVWKIKGGKPLAEVGILKFINTLEVYESIWKYTEVRGSTRKSDFPCTKKWLVYPLENYLLTSYTCLKNIFGRTADVLNTFKNKLFLEYI